MSKKHKIYTAGKMSGFSYDEQMGWRFDAEEEIKNSADEVPQFIHPPIFYNYNEHFHHSDQEIFDWDLEKIRECDIVIVNLNSVQDSVGTLMELGFVNAINRCGGKHIFVIGICDPDKYNDLHPWVKLAVHRVEQDAIGAASYICDYLLL